MRCQRMRRRNSVLDRGMLISRGDRFGVELPLLGLPLSMLHMVGYRPVVIFALYISFITFSVWVVGLV